MTREIHNFFKNLKNHEPSAELEAGILKAVAVKKTLRIKRNLMLARAGLTVSFGALAYTLVVFGRAFFNSDFWNLVKLAFTDTGVIAKNIGVFSVSLLETLPVVDIFAMLVPVFALLAIASWYFKFSNNNFNHA